MTLALVALGAWAVAGAGPEVERMSIEEQIQGRLAAFDGRVGWRRAISTAASRECATCS